MAEQESWRKEINRPIYHIHKWWATRLGSVFRAVILGALTPSTHDIWGEFYSRHALKGKIVLDPFMGSGTTLGEAIKLGAKAIGCDINPISTFMVRQAFTRVPLERLCDAFLELEEHVAPEIAQYYQTRDPESGELIPVLYFFWVKTVTTPENEIVPLFSRYVFAQDAYPTKKPRAQIVCPDCWGLLEDNYDATDITCEHCSNRFNPQDGPAKGQYVRTKAGTQYRIKELQRGVNPPEHRLYAIIALRTNGEKIYLRPQDEDYQLYLQAEQRLHREELPLPILRVRSGHNTDQARGYNYNRWRDFFNARQLLALGILLRAILRIKEETIREQLLCLFSSTLEFNNLFCSFKGEGTGAVRHMFSHHILKPERTPLENCVWGTARSSGTFKTLFESRLLRAKRYLDEPFEMALRDNLTAAGSTPTKLVASAPINVRHVDSWDELAASDNALMTLNGNSSKLPLPDSCVDAIVTDPPYFDYVHYSELSDFFFAWLSPALSSRYTWFRREDSSDPGEVQHKDPKSFSRQLATVLSECHRVLKDQGVLAFSFHHSRSEAWVAIYEALRMSGFVVVAAHPVHGEIRGSSPKNATKHPISIDAILVCKKALPESRRDAMRRDVVSSVEASAQQFKNAQLGISLADEFVIAAAQLLVLGSMESWSGEKLATEIDAFRSRLEQTRTSQQGTTELASRQIPIAAG